MNRGARGWEPKLKVKFPEEPRAEVEPVEPAVDMIEVDGVWMTKEDAKHARTDHRPKAS